MAIQYLSLTGLQNYDQKIKAFVESKVSEGDAKSIKHIDFDRENGILKFYTVNPVTNEAAAYEVELPEQDLSHLMQLVADATEGNVASFGANGQVVDSGIKASDIVKVSDLEAVSDKADANEAAIAEINDEENGILKQAKDYADGKDTAIQAAKTAADEAKSLADANKELIGTIPETAAATDIVGYVQEKTAGIATSENLEELTNRVAQAETDIQTISDDYLKKADKDELVAKDTEIETKVTTLIGDDAGKSARTIANEELAKQLIADNAKESLDTLAEIAAWIQSHPDDASAMSKAIDDLEALVGTLPEGVTATTIVGYIQEVVATEKSRAEGIESDLDTRISALEEAVGDSDVASDIEAAKNEAITTAAEDATTKANQALADSKSYTDTEVAKDRVRLDALEADTHTHANKELLDTYDQTNANIKNAVDKAHEHENKEELDLIVSGDVAKWNSAEQNAKDYVDAEIGKIDLSGIETNATAIQNLTNTHNTDKQTLQAGIDANAQAVEDLEASLQEISEAEINALFGITE